MSIDWFTFSAQVLNFIVLVWLLKHFLYGPIIAAMDDRETKIADQIAAAAVAKRRADETRQLHEEKLNDIESTRDNRLAAVTREVSDWRSSRLKTAAQEVETERNRWTEMLDREKQSLLQKLQLSATRHATDLSHHVLQQLADESLQHRLTEKLLSLIQQHETLAQPLRTLADDGPILVETSHALSADDQRRITETIRKVTGDNAVAIEFRVDSRLICGIELRSTACRITWSISDALEELKAALEDAVNHTLPDRQAITASDGDSLLKPEAPVA